MKALLISTAVVALIWAMPAALAQEEHHDKGHQGEHSGGAAPTGSTGAPHGHMGEGHLGGAAVMQATPRNTMEHSRGTARVRNENAMRGGAMHGPERAQGHADFHAYQRNVTAPRHFHAGQYRAPQGYRYRRWSYGERLPRLFFGRDYWIDDFGLYDLMPPPPGAVWVRYGPDALLIDEGSGEVIQVEYGVFF